MIIDTYSFNQSQSIRDQEILSRKMITDTSKNTLILTILRMSNALDEMMYLHRYSCTCRSTYVPVGVQNVLWEARYVLLNLFSCTCKSTEVYSIK